MLTTDRVAGAALVVLGALVLLESRKLPLGTLRNPGPAYAPVILAGLVLVFGAVVLVFGAGSPRVRAAGWTEGRHAVAIFCACAFAALALERLGFRLTVALTLGFLLGIVERRGWLFTVAFAVGLSLATYLLFQTFLRVPLPRGPLGL